MDTHVTAIDDRTWDEFILANGGNFLQSWGWSQFQEALGREVYRVRLESSPEGGEATVASQFVLMIMPIKFGFKFAYAPRGPVVSREGWPGQATERFHAAVSAIREAARQKNAVFVRVEPPAPSDSPIISIEKLEDSGLVYFGHVQPQDTSIVDLSGEEKDILARMHQKTRYNIGLAERRGVTIREADYSNAQNLLNDFESFWKLLSETAERDEFHTHPRSYYQAMAEALSPSRTHKDGLKVRLFLAEAEGRAVAGGLFAEFGVTVTYLHGASSYADRNLMAPFLLHWKVIQSAKRSGFLKYDLWGVAPEHAGDEHSWAGITRFKLGFGGERESYQGAWDLPVRSVAYLAYRLARRH